MKENTELIIYKRGKNILISSISLAAVVIASIGVGFQISENQLKSEEQKRKMEMALRDYKYKSEMLEMTKNYDAFQDELEKNISEAETTRKVVTPSSAKFEKKEEVEQKTTNNLVEQSSHTPPTEYKEVIEVRATSYCLCKKCCGKSVDNSGYGVTRSGLKIVPGTGMKVIAVDPKVIPLGSKVYVEGINGVADYGYAVAADTGGAIKNNKIDLYMDSHEDTVKWGIKNMKVYVIE